MNVDQKLIAFGIITALVVGLATIAYNIYDSTLKNEAYVKCITTYREVMRDLNDKTDRMITAPTTLCYMR